MTETICPCCGAKVKTDGRASHHYIPLPQPDLTKLREVYEKHLVIVDTERNNYKPGISDVDEIEATILNSGREVINAVKELLEQEGRI